MIMLDNLGSEVSSKIRQAIKAKLQELNAYVDDELPDYIMVMVANKKEPEAMKVDLVLFLNEHTNVFVDWLSDVLEKLKKVTLGEGKPKKKITKKKVKKVTEDQTTKTKTRKTTKKAASSEKEPSKKEFSSEKDKKRSSKKSPSRERPRLDEGERKVPSRSRKRKSPSPRPSRDRSGTNRTRTDSRDGNPRAREHHKDRRADHNSRDSRDAKNDRIRRWNDSGTRREHSRPTVSSKIGAVISHDSDGEYNPEEMLKKSIRASEVKVTDRPKSKVAPNKNLIMKAVAEADASIQRKDREDRRKESELDAVHDKRRQLSKALRAGKLSDEKIKEINHSVEKKREKCEDDRRFQSEDLMLDLRHRLSRKRKNSPDTSEYAHQSHHKDRFESKRMSITVQIRNDKDSYSETRPDRESSSSRVRSDPKTRRGEEKEALKVSYEDLRLERMRKRALESMARKRRTSSEEGNLIIPLGDETLDEPVETDQEANAGRETSSSSSSDSSDTDEEESEVSLSDVEELQERGSKSNPKFIVTLDGLDKKFFNKPHSDKPTGPLRTSLSLSSKGESLKDAPKSKLLQPKTEPTNKKSSSKSSEPVNIKVKPTTCKPTAPVIEQRTKRPLGVGASQSSPVKKPEAKVAPLRISPKEKPADSEVRKPTKPKRARITAPEPDNHPKPKSKLITSIPDHVLSGKVSSGSNSNKSVCRYWPKCTRGQECFYFHPKTGVTDKFKWTSASSMP